VVKLTAILDWLFGCSFFFINKKKSTQQQRGCKGALFPTSTVKLFQQWNSSKVSKGSGGVMSIHEKQKKIIKKLTEGVCDHY
jgi:hypothetical protein